jgi:hypothetical protein
MDKIKSQNFDKMLLKNYDFIYILHLPLHDAHN